MHYLPLQSTSSSSPDDNKGWSESVNLETPMSTICTNPPAITVTYSLRNHMLRTLAMNHFHCNPYLEQCFPQQSDASLGNGLNGTDAIRLCLGHAFGINRAGFAVSSRPKATQKRAR